MVNLRHTHWRDVSCGSSPAWIIAVFILSSLHDVGESWPGGTYGLPKPKSGCPNATNFQWLSGFRTQITEPGNSVSSHLHLAGRFDHSLIEQQFCMKLSVVQDGASYSWKKGQYCIYKKGECPHRFGAGFIYWDDGTAFLGDHRERHSKDLNALPDGDYGANTKIWFCCRGDGKYYKPIELPVTSPFYLLKFAKHCQEVVGMSVREEWVLWRDESSINNNAQRWPHPNLDRPHNQDTSKLHYCYYQPKSQGSVQRTTIAAVVGVVCATIGILIITILICIFSTKYRQSQQRHGNVYSIPAEQQRPTYHRQRSEVAVNTEVSCATEVTPMVGKIDPLGGAAGGDQPPSYEEAVQQQNNENERSLQEKVKSEPQNVANSEEV